MEDFSTTTISQDGSYNYSYIDYDDLFEFVFEPHETPISIFFVLTCIIITIGLPLTLVAIFAFCSLVQKDYVAPIYVINLLISDLIQFCCMIVKVVQSEVWRINATFSNIHLYSLMVSVGFMMCIALERYLVIACPQWYRSKRTIKTSVVVCVVVWVLILVFAVIGFVGLFVFETTLIPTKIFAIVFLLPLPLFIFFLVGTFKAMPAATSVPSDEKRQIIGVLVLVLLNYTLLFLPAIIWSIVEELVFIPTPANLCFMLLKTSPLADLFLYVFMRKGVTDKLLASACCRMDSNDSSTSPI